MKSSIKNILRVSFMFCAAGAFGQQITFENTYSFGTSSQAQCVVQDSDSSYVISGQSDGDLLVAKIHSSGTGILWSHTYGGPGNDHGTYITKTSDGGFIITGMYGATQSDGDIYLLKLDDSGLMQWSQTFAYSISDIGYAVRETSDGGYIIAGYAFSASGPYTMRLIKTDAVGGLQWEKEYYTHYLTDVRETPDGGFMAFGTRGNGANGSDVVLFKVDSAGNELWAQNYGTTDPEASKRFTTTYDGGYAFVSNVNGVFHLMKVDGSGNVVFDKTAGVDLLWDAEGSIVETQSDSGLAITGRRLTTDVCPIDTLMTTDVYVIRTDKNGDTLWTKSIGMNSYSENSYMMKNTYDKGYIIAGYRVACAPGNSEVYLIKLGKPSQTLSLDNEEQKTNEIIIFPNPVIGSSSIRLDPSLRGKNISVTLYNSLGQVVKEAAQVSDNEAIISRDELGSGIYIYKVKADEELISTGKLIVQ